jgi:hypothetical protein
MFIVFFADIPVNEISMYSFGDYEAQGGEISTGQLEMWFFLNGGLFLPQF